MNIPDFTELIKKIRTRKEATELAEIMLTDYRLNKLGPNAKIVDIESAIIKRAETNKKIHQQLQNYLYERVEITASKVQYELGITSYFLKKLVSHGILIPTSEKENKYGNGMIHYFSYASILHCVNNSQFETMKENYDVKHAKNVLRAEKIDEIRLIDVEQKVNKFDVRIRRVDPETLYRRALDSKSTNERKFNPLDFPTYHDLDRAPDEDRNRWVDNYIRHRLTNYDHLDHYLEGKYFVENMYEKAVPDKFTEAIRKVYPFYKRNTYLNEYRK